MNTPNFIKKFTLYITLLCGIITFAPSTAENVPTIELLHARDFNSSNCCCQGERKKPEIFKHFGEQVTLDIIMTIPQLNQPAPPGGNLDVTPFAIGPNGKIYRGEVTNIVPTTGGFVQALNPVKIPHPVQGNYVIGYFITLGAGSPIFNPNTIGNFSGVLINNAVGALFQSVTFPVQTLFINVLSSDADVLTVTGNFPIVKN